MDGTQLLEQAMNTQRSVASFMLRFTQDLWQDENGEPKVQWQGRINHVQGGEDLPFTDFTDALTFIQKQLQDLTLQAVPAADTATQEKALQESFKIWEQFAAGYSGMVFKAMEDAFRQSQEIRSQAGEAFTRAFELWMPPAFRSESAAPATAETRIDLMKQIENLSAQVQALSKKIQELEKQEK